MSSFVRPPGTTIYRELDADSLPVIHEERGSRIAGTFGVLIGGSVALPIVGLVVTVSELGYTLEALKMAGVWLLILVPCLACLYWGVNQFVRRDIIEITAEAVSWTRRSLRGTTVTAEPLSAFEGVRLLERWQREDGDLTELILQHPDPAKSILLYRANRRAGLAERWKQYCVVLRRPPVEYLAPGTAVSRDVDDVGRPILDVIREGRLDVPEPGPAPEGAVIERGVTDTVVRAGRDVVLRISAEGVTRGGREHPEFRTEDVDALTIEPGRGAAYRRLWLKLSYRRTFHKSDGSPDVMSVNVSLADGLPEATLVWLQRILLTVLAER